MKLSDLLAGFSETELFSKDVDIVISHLSEDSRLIQPGSLFLAREGTTKHGSDYIHAAIKQGAVAVLVDAVHQKNMTREENTIIVPIKNLRENEHNIAARFYDYPAKHMQIIGITGTNGKTSCTHFIADSLQQLNIPCGVIGTLGNGLFGSALTSSGLTTPDAITLQKTFRDFLNQGAKTAAMEVSSHSLDQGRVEGIVFDIGVFTNLTRDHLDYHKTMEAYAAAKKRLFQQTKFAVINADDAFGRELINSLSFSSASISRETVFSYQLPSHDNIKLDTDGLHAMISTPFGAGELHANLIGDFNLSNLLAVVTTLCLLDIPLKTALNCMAHLKSVPGRMQMAGGKDKPLVIIDYAHTPDALEKVLSSLRAHTAQKLFCVFGCGGDRDRGKRPLMARIAERYADQVILTDDNPRHENPADIITDILAGFSDPLKIMIEHDRSKAIRNVIHYAQKGDCVLIAGKGAETYQIIFDEKIPFSDLEEVNASLA